MNDIRPRVLRIVGALALFCAAAGFLLGGLGAWMGEKTRDRAALGNPEVQARIRESLAAMPDGPTGPAADKAIDELLATTQSSEFRTDFWTFVAVDVVLNLGLLVAGIGLVRGRPAGRVAFLVVAGAAGIYLKIVPRFIFGADAHLAAAAAWGVGNMGMAMQLTWFWAWGAVLVVWAGFTGNTDARSPPPATEQAEA
jgi:hypothetical protein